MPSPTSGAGAGAGPLPSSDSFDQDVAKALNSVAPGKGYGAAYLAFINANPGLAGSPSALSIWVSTDNIPLTNAQQNKVFAAASATGHGPLSLLPASSSSTLNPFGAGAASWWVRGGEILGGAVLLGIGVNAMLRGRPLAIVTSAAGLVGKAVP